jgi:hypothetical protein
MVLMVLVPVFPARSDLGPPTLENIDGSLITQGVYGDTIIVLGQSGEVPAGAILEVYWDDTTIGWNGVKGKLNSTTAYSDGSYEVWFDVPESDYGVHYVWVKVGFDSNTAPLSVVAVVYPASSIGVVGDEIDVYVFGQSKNKDIAMVLVSTEGIKNWNWVAVTQLVVNIDIGETEYDGTLSGDLVEPGSVVITSNLGVVTDDGEGSLEGDGDGAINYVTGEWVLEFDVAPRSVFTFDYKEFIEAPDRDFLLSSTGTSNSVGSYVNQITVPEVIDYGSYYIETLDSDGVSGSTGAVRDKPKLYVSIVSPGNGTSFDSSPVQLKARVSSDGSFVKNAEVKFFVNGGYFDTKISNHRGISLLDLSLPSEGTYTWYVQAFKNRYDEDVSSAHSFTYNDLRAETDIEEGIVETYRVIEIFFFDDIQSLNTGQYGAYTFVTQNRRYAYSSFSLCQVVIDEIRNE